MRIIEIKADDLGGHSNQTINGVLNKIPDGWAVIPDDMECENFPYGTLKTKTIDGVLTVTKWTAGTLPEAPEPTPTEVEQLRADIDYIAIMTGVDLI